MKQTQTKIQKKTLFIFKTVKNSVNGMSTDPTTTSATITTYGYLHDNNVK